MERLKDVKIFEQDIERPEHILFIIVKIMIFMLICGAIGYGMIYYLERNYRKEYTYTGEVVGKLYEAPTSGRKASTPSKYYILLKENRTDKVIRVLVNIPTYYGLNDGDKTSFKLSNSQMYHYGNTTDGSLNLYGE